MVAVRLPNRGIVVVVVVVVVVAVQQEATGGVLRGRGEEERGGGGGRVIHQNSGIEGMRTKSKVETKEVQGLIVPDSAVNVEKERPVPTIYLVPSLTRDVHSSEVRSANWFTAMFQPYISANAL